MSASGSSTSEDARVAKLAELFSVAGDAVRVPIGDDAAVVRCGGEYSVTSVDGVVEGIHFELAAFGPRAVGRKATGAALSDLAAMGVPASEVYLAAGVPADFDEQQFAELAAGVAEVAEQAGAAVVGGDLSAAKELWLSATVVGYAADVDQVITRSGARAGDVVAVTGALGASTLATELLSASESAGDYSDSERQLISRQLAPSPRLAAGQALAAAGASAMIDVSDGLARDANHLARASNCELVIELSRLPVEPVAAEQAQRSQRDPFLLAAQSGEEYELLVTVPAGSFDAAVIASRAAGCELTRIGCVKDRGAAAPRAVFLDGGGKVADVRGFDHFDRTD